MTARWRTWWRGPGRAARDYLFSRAGRAPLPMTHASLDLTHRCNLRCDVCFLYGAHLAPDYPSLAELAAREELDPAEWRAAIDDLRALGVRRLVLTGGEVFCKDGFLGILAHAVGAGFRVSVLTNGTLIDTDAADRIARIGPDLVRFSLDGDRAAHDAICGAPAFDRLLRGIERIREAKSRRGARRPRLGFETVLQRANQGALEAIVETALAHGIDSVLFSNVFFTSGGHFRRADPSVGAGQTTRGVDPKRGRVDPEALAEEIERCRARAAAGGIEFRCHLRTAAQIRHTYESSRYAPVGRCLYPWMMCRIDPYGDVIPCTGSRRAMGNVRTAPLGEIWNGPPYRAFRRELRAAGLFPDCAKCNTLADPRWRWWDFLPRPVG